MNAATRQEIAELSRTATHAMDRLQDAVTTAIAEEGDPRTIGSVAADFEKARAFVAFWANPEQTA